MPQLQFADVYYRRNRQFKKPCDFFPLQPLRQRACLVGTDYRGLEPAIGATAVDRFPASVDASSVRRLSGLLRRRRSATIWINQGFREDDNAQAVLS